MGRVSEPIKVAVQAYDRTMPLIRGEVAIGAGDINVSITVVKTPDESWRGLLDGTFQVAETSFATFIKAKEQGQALVAIPVFPNRKFFQYYIFTRSQSDIRTVNDLRGRKVATPLYWMTSAVWQRGILKEEYGITPEDIEWYTTAPERMPSLKIPTGVRVTLVEGRTAEDLLLNGDVHCLMTARTTPLITQNRNQLARPFDDIDAVVRNYYQRTGIFGIAHTIVLQQEVIMRHPWLPTSVYEAFQKAKDLCYGSLEDDALTSLPLMRSYLDDSRSFFGDDAWPYGIARNRKALDKFLEYAQDQGLIEKPLPLEALFAKETWDF
jgi:4,5-dihydroxyphthalate decarboxylase